MVQIDGRRSGHHPKCRGLQRCKQSDGIHSRSPYGQNMRLALGLVVLAMGSACGQQRAPDPQIGPACGALLALADRAQSCDPELRALTASIARKPNEISCQLAARRMLGSPQPSPPRVRSVFEPSNTPQPGQLSADERAQLQRLPLPATLVINPDIPPGPGIAPTRANVDALTLNRDAQGQLRATVSPGVREVELSHAGHKQRYCVELDACSTVEVVAHGGLLARHPAIHDGPCPRRSESRVAATNGTLAAPAKIPQ